MFLGKLVTYIYIFPNNFRFCKQYLRLKTRDVESKEFSFDSQFPVPKMISESDTQAPKIVEFPKATGFCKGFVLFLTNKVLLLLFYILIFRFDSQFPVSKIVRESNSQLPRPKNNSTPNCDSTSLLKTWPFFVDFFQNIPSLCYIQFMLFFGNWQI